MSSYETIYFIKRARKERHWNDLKEEEAIQSIILPVLESLGWTIDNPAQVRRAVKLGHHIVDFCLNPSGPFPVVLEAKRPAERLDDHERQLLLYAFEFATPIAILTNGIVWRLYRPTALGWWDDRRFAAIDLRKDDPDVAMRKFQRYLARKEYESGRVLQSAEKALLSNKSRRGAVGGLSGICSPKRSISRSQSPNVRRITATGSTTKTQLVFDELRARWITGPELTDLTGQKGGWPKWVHKLYVDSGKYGRLVLLWKKNDRPSHLRLATPEQAALLRREPSVSVYPD